MNECECPGCGSPEATILGQLGSLEHYRCRQCGMDYSAEVDSDANDDDDDGQPDERQEWHDFDPDC